MRREFNQLDEELCRKGLSNDDRKMWRRLWYANWLMENGDKLGLPTSIS